MLFTSLIFLLGTFVLPNPVDSEDTDPYLDTDYRLNNVVPSAYILNLTLPNAVFDTTQNNNTFSGIVIIKFTVKENTKKLHIHGSKEMKIVKSSITNNTIKVNFNQTTSTFLLTSENALVSKKQYTLQLEYTATVNDKSMHGLYRSSYREENKTQYLLATQFETLSAREAFPCFDEPKLKATFTITVTYPTDYTAISNTEEISTTLNETKTTTFKETPKMSTYLVALIVSKFNSTTTDKVTVYSRPSFKNSTQLAANWGSEILKALENYTGINYDEKNIGLKKLVQVAVPDFGAGAMENWGLVTAREQFLLYQNGSSSDAYLQNILMTIAHEFTHQWFGDYVTCNWWNQIVLNEGFAAYFQYYILNTMNNLTDWEFTKQSVVSQLQPALVEDGLNSSKAVVSDVSTPEEISSKFNTIVYNKGASIFKMLSSMLGKDNFRDALREYLQGENIGRLSSLYKALDNHLPDSCKDSKSSEVFGNWFTKPGYPMVIVKQTNDSFELSQKRFLYDNGTDNTTWYIPITYTMDSGDFTNLTSQLWLKTDDNSTKISMKNNNSWIILNNQQNGFYRVYYTSEIREKISEKLSEKLEDIDVLNRAQLVDDVLNFARVNSKDAPLSYAEALKFIEYLTNETEYYPWVSAINNFRFLLIRLGENSDEGQAMKNKILKWMDKVYAKYDFKENTTSIDSLARELIFTTACRFGHDDCKDQATSLFKDYKDNNRTIDPNLRSVVYCNALRYSDDANDWTFLWNKYLESEVSSEKDVILGALGCTRNTDLLTEYLKMSYNTTNNPSDIRIQDFAAVWNSVYSSSQEGIDTALDFLINNHKDLLNYTSSASQLLTSIASKVNTDDQIQKITNFLNRDETEEEYKKSKENINNSLGLNKQWMDRFKNDLANYFSSDASITAASYYLSFLFIIIMKFVIDY